ncbi:MAG: stage III sporulation protein AE [Oscillospiraceae bacterium]|nr:stage III sporulation protein AE [Oscillospiraceae bacterium]
MKKLLLTITILFAITYALSPTAMAVSEDDVFRRQSDLLELHGLENALTGEADALLGDLTVMDSLNVDRGLSRLLASVRQRAGNILRSGLRDAVLIILIAILCSLVSTTFGGAGANYAVLAGVLAIAAVSVTSANSFIGLGRQTLNELDAFSKMLLPALTGAAASSGAITSAAAKYAATVLFMNIMIMISNGIIMPLILAYIAVSIADAVSVSTTLAGAGELLKWLAKTILTVIIIAFIAYMAITGVITGTSDAVAIRAAKVAISTVLPVVGSIIADASETMLVGASVLRNAVGIFGLLAVSAICIIPFLRLGVSYLLFKAAGAISGAIADKKIGGLVNAISSAFGLALAMVGVSALMMYVSIISVIRFTI